MRQAVFINEYFKFLTLEVNESWVQRHVPIVPATQKIEAEESLEPKSSRPD